MEDVFQSHCWYCGVVTSEEHQYSLICKDCDTEEHRQRQAELLKKIK